jgi:hypothetical protein
MANPKTAADHEFERYLRANDYSFEYEPDPVEQFAVETSRTPDYLVTREDVGCRRPRCCEGWATSSPDQDHGGGGWQRADRGHEKRLDLRSGRAPI